MRLSVLTSLLLVVPTTLFAATPSTPYAHTVLQAPQSIGMGQVTAAGKNTRGSIRVVAEQPGSGASARSYGGWVLPPSEVKIKEAWLIADVVSDKPIGNPVGIPLAVHFIPNAFDAAASHNSAAVYQQLDDGLPISLPPARRESGSLLAIPFSAEAILWLEARRLSGMEELNLGFVEQAGNEIDVKLDNPHILLNPPHVPGDANGDGLVNVFDVAPFAASVIGDAEAYESMTGLPLAFHDLDLNYSGAVDSLDIAPFVNMITGAVAAAPAGEQAGIAAIPEPAGLALLLVGSACLLAQALRRTRHAACTRG